MSNVYLVGFMGAGKTAAGEALAARLGRDFIDLDERLIERFGAPISEIFEQQGENAFRAAETEELARISHQLPAAAGDAPHPAVFSRLGVLDVPPGTPPRPSGRKLHWSRHPAVLPTEPGEICGLARAAALAEVVVATGGGAFCNAANREIIHGSGGVSVFLDLPWVEIQRRLPGRNLDRPMFGSAQNARELFERRLPDYRRATLTVSLSGDESGADVVDGIVEALEEKPCAT